MNHSFQLNCSKTVKELRPDWRNQQVVPSPTSVFHTLRSQDESVSHHEDVGHYGHIDQIERKKDRTRPGPGFNVALMVSKTLLVTECLINVKCIYLFFVVVQHCSFAQFRINKMHLFYSMETGDRPPLCPTAAQSQRRRPVLMSLWCFSGPECPGSANSVLPISRASKTAQVCLHESRLQVNAGVRENSRKTPRQGPRLALF